MTISKLRLFDLLIFGFLAVVLDIILVLTGFMGIRVYLAISYPIMFLCYVRWGKYGLFVNLAVLITHLFLFMSQVTSLIPHLLGIAAFSGTLLTLRYEPMSRKKIPFWALTLCFTLVYLVTVLVEWACHLPFSDSIPILTAFINQIYNLGLGIGLLAIIYAQKILLVRMDRYLLEAKEGKLPENE